MKLLNDRQMQDFIVNGYVTVQADFSRAFHESVYAQAIFSTEGNPGNDILPKIPELADLFAHPAVTGALTSLLGPGYAMHPHRHCHLTRPRRPAQRQHQDSYEDDQNVRHHRARWAMAFYYPQDVSADMGPTSVLPASQYYMSPAQAARQDEALLCGDAGAVTIVHYDLWHRASTNRSSRNRYMMKFLFCRMTEPTGPSWDSRSPSWRAPSATTAAPNLWQSVWNWRLARDQKPASTLWRPTDLLKTSAIVRKVHPGAARPGGRRRTRGVPPVLPKQKGWKKSTCCPPKGNLARLR